MYVILLSPSTMEDAGRFQYIGVFPSLAEAETKRIQLSIDSKGYHRVQSFRIFKEMTNEIRS